MKIIVQHDDGTTADITEGVKVAFDTAYNSMDWGSGFLDLEEMETLARLAEACRFPSFQEALERIQAQRQQEERQQEALEQHRREEAARRARAAAVRATWQDPQGLPITHGIIIGRN